MLLLLRSHPRLIHDRRAVELVEDHDAAWEVLEDMDGRTPYQLGFTTLNVHLHERVL